MARKHAKKFSQKQPVGTVLVRPQIVSKEREVVEVTADTPNAIPVVQEDGSTKYFIVRPKITPAVYAQGKAQGPTTTRGQKNDPKNMAPKGAKGAAPLTKKKDRS